MKKSVIIVISILILSNFSVFGSILNPSISIGEKSARWDEVSEDKNPNGKTGDMSPSEFADFLIENSDWIKSNNPFSSASKEQAQEFIKIKTDSRDFKVNNNHVDFNPLTGDVDVSIPGANGKVELGAEALDGKETRVGEDSAFVRDPETNANTEINDGRLEDPNQQPPSQQSPIGSGSGGGSASVGGAGGAMQQIMGIIQQVMSIVSQIGQGLKAAAQNQGSSKILKDGEDVKVSVDDGSSVGVTEEKENCREVCEEECDEEDNCKEVCREVCDRRKVVLSQENESKKESETVFKEGKMDEVVASSNTKVHIPEQIVAHISEDTPETTISNQGISEDYSRITGNVILDDKEQLIKLYGYSMEIKGEKLKIDLLKSFNEIKSTGSEILINDNETQIYFKENKTYYPRRIKFVNYSINRIKNGYDKKNIFSLKKQFNGNILIDIDKRISVGNIIEKIQDYDLRISYIRNKMF